jgi:fructokinase
MSADPVLEPPQVLCFGEALVDRLGPPGGLGGPTEDRLGGAPANAAAALARLGTPAAFLGRLGEDAIGAAFAALFSERGVDDAALQWDPSRPSRTVLVERDHDGERRFGGFAGDRGMGFADQAVAAELLAAPLEALLAEARWLLVGTIPLASPAAAAALRLALSRARARGVAVALDVNWRPTFWGLPADQGPSPAQLERFQPLLEQADLIKCAAEEAAWLFGPEAEPQAIRERLSGRPAVLISDSERPLRWCIGACSGVQPSFPVAMVDSTGAGDAFTAGLLHGLCRQPELLEATAADLGRLESLLRFACACGAITCGGAGAIDPQPTGLEVERFLMEQAAPLPA